MKEAQKTIPEILYNSRALAALWQGIRDEDRYKLHPFPAESKLLNLVLRDRALIEMKHYIKEAREVMAEVLDENQGLAANCLSGKNAEKVQQKGCPGTQYASGRCAARQSPSSCNKNAEISVLCTGL